MWLLVWQFQGVVASQVYASMFFGVITGLLLAVEVARIRRKYGVTDFDSWLKANGLK
ncbi:hypothetical protein VCHE40_3213 [Vibrio cholerae HE-40]|nr:hypothetical protein VCHE39_3640 [Vibrio cholerae HE39]EKL34647.1 hypothetical protein VCHE40_3213 [Vibrio cholerae HE-40]EKL37815.1 hypothetical protein VCHE46_3222 [Vibrio cholerae HE-46]